MKRIYLDNAATTPLLPGVKEIICNALDIWGNPSSPHAIGCEAREHLEETRRNIASILGVGPEEIIFTSCATEGNNTVLRSVIQEKDKGNIVVSSIEHKSVSAYVKYLSSEGFEVRQIRVNKEGVVDLEHLESLIDENTLLVSVMYVSNEFGTVQPIEDIARICSQRGIPFHTDAVQAVAKIKINLKDVTYATFSGHKFHAPKGVGFMVTREDIQPLLMGGGQERGRRSGTENLQGILAMGKALEIIYGDFRENVKKLRFMRDRFERLLLERIPDLKIVGYGVERNPSISAVIFPRLTGWEIVKRLSDLGLMCSSGSACTSGEVIPNAHLMSMGYSPEEAIRMVRFSFGLLNKEEEIDEAVEMILKLYE